MSNERSPIPLIPSASLIAEARTTVPGTWLENRLKRESAHWRLENQPALVEAEAALRALFLIAHRKCSEPKPPRRDDFRPLYAGVNALHAAHLRSPKQRIDERYGKGFYTAVRAHSQVLVDHTPSSNPLELLLLFCEFLRFDAPGLGPARGPAASALEEVWEHMNVGWIN